ncbi:MAG: hypothetical protein K2G38_07250, partial [Clostridia bacterium]|nr:hypothetical protein [Clostridia bacterium]
MFKLWKRNKDKGGVKVKKPRKIALFACAAALLASVTGASIMLGLNSHNGGNLGGDSFINTGIEGNTASATSAAVTTIANDWKYKVVMKHTTEKSLEDLWNEACSYTDGTVYVIFEENWTAPNTTGDGFGSGANFDTGAINVAAGKNIV